MNETRSSNTSFIDSTRSGTLIASELKAKEKRRREKESDAEFVEKQRKGANFNDVYEGEWFVDAEEDEELADTMLKKHGFGTYK